MQFDKVTYYLLTECTKHLLSGLSIYLDKVLKPSKIEIPIHVCVQKYVAVGNNQSARLIVSYFIIDTYMNGCSYIVILTSRGASPCVNC